MRIALAAMSFLAALSFLPPALAEDRIVAVVNNEVITSKDLEGFTTFTRMQLSQKLSGQDLEAKVESMKADLLQRLIEDRLILQEARKSGVKIDDSRVKAKMAEIKKRYETEKEFSEALLQQGLSESDVEARVREQMMMYALIDGKIRESIQVKPAEITEYYERNREELEKPERRHVVSLTVPDKRSAKDLVEALRSGRYAQGAAEEKGFKVSDFKAQRGELRKEVDDIVFQLDAGGVSDPIEINGEYFVFQVKEIIPQELPELAEMQDEIHALVYEKKMQEKVASWLDELKGSSYIKITE